MTLFYSPYLVTSLATLDPAYRILALVAYCVVMTRNYRLIKEVDQHRRMKWVVYGSLLGIIPEVMILITRFLLVSAGYGHVLSSDTFVIMNQMANTAIGIVPITWGYAIIKHRVFEINVVIRQGLQYLLARNVLQLLFALPLIALTYTIISNRNQTISDIVAHNPVYLTLIAIAGVGFTDPRASARALGLTAREAACMPKSMLRRATTATTTTTLPGGVGRVRVR